MAIFMASEPLGGGVHKTLTRAIERKYSMEQTSVKLTELVVTIDIYTNICIYVYGGDDQPASSS